MPFKKKSFLVTVWDQPLWSFSSFAGPNGQQYADRSQRELPHLRHWLVHIRQGCAGFWRRLHPSAGDGHEVRQLPHGWTRPDWWARERRVWRNYKLYIVVWGENYMSIHISDNDTWCNTARDGINSHGLMCSFWSAGNTFRSSVVSLPAASPSCPHSQGFPPAAALVRNLHHGHHSSVS